MTRDRFRLGLIGYPLGHSLSPQIHHAALNELGLQGEYRLYPIPPLPEGTPDLVDLLAKIRTGKIDGLNVTIPHKQSIISMLDELMTTASMTGAVNTIFRKKQHLVGENTDVEGFLTDLKRHLPQDFDRKFGLVLGAGGAARAVVYGLLREGWQVIIAARRYDRAEMLAAYFRDQRPAQPGRIEPAPLIEMGGEDFQRKITLIVNTTPLGMTPNTEASPWPQGIPWPQHALVYDLVYNPPETTWMRDAREAGLVAVSGLGMLVEQAALSFELWTGFSAPRPAMALAVNRPESVEPSPFPQDES